MTSLLIVIIIDYITGLIQAYINRTLKSRLAINGALRKLGYVALVAISYPLESVVNMPAVSLITTALIIGEIISVCENVNKMGVKLPKVIVKILERLEQEENEL